MNMKTLLDRTLVSLESSSPGISKHKSQSMKISHGSPDLKKDTFKLINDNVGEASGVYIYHVKDKVYYVGKAKLGVSSGLDIRMKCHYKESVFNEADYEDGRIGIAGDKWRGDYPAYFRDHLKGVPLTVTWVQIEGDYHDGEFRRIMVEALLTDQLKPEFVGFGEARKAEHRAKKVNNISDFTKNKLV